MYSYGMVPYMAWTNEVVIERVTSGFRLSPPTNCPDDVYDVMYKCWNEDPEKRPNFADLSQIVCKLPLGPANVDVNVNVTIVPNNDAYYN
jgi:hypothetical protein